MVKHFTKESFESEVLKATKPVLVDFFADWCGPCKMMAPVIEEIAGERDDVEVGKLDVDSETEIAGRYNVSGIPTLILFNNGEEVDRQVGFGGKAAIEAMLDKASGR